MIRTKTFFYSLLLLICGINTFAQQLDTLKINQVVVIKLSNDAYVSVNDLKKEIGDSMIAESSLSLQNTFLLNNSFKNGDTAIVPPRDYRRLAYNTGLFGATTVVVFGVLWVLPESVTNWDKEEMKENGITDKWKQNVKAGPVWDSDNFFLNFIAHPYAGAVYYMTARSSGFTMFESFVYSAFVSTFFWEYGIEAFAEIPSWQDLFVTPIVGSMFGEGFFYLKKSIIKNDSRVLNSRLLGKTTIFLMDPFNTVLDGLGYQTRVKTQFNVTPIGFDNRSGKPVWGLNFSAHF
jgi:hypothetical protein